MGKLAGKVIEATPANVQSHVSDVGNELRKLRVLSGLTQEEMAARLGIRQAAISKFEKGRDVYLSTVERYVAALGASLRVDAVFPADAPVSLHIRDAFEVEFSRDDQLVLPLLDDDQFRPQRDVVLSIKPQYSAKILDGVKTVELRRRFPVLAPSGTLAYIYSTSPERAMIGSAEIKEVLKMPIDSIWNEFQNNAHIGRDDFANYFQGLEFGFVLVLDRAKPLARAIPLEELRERFDFEPPQSFLYASRDLRKALRDEPTVVSH